jgi:hypothetical protein
MAPSRLQLEFVDGSRPAIEVPQPDVIVGRAASCAVRLEGEGVSDKHARLTRDAAGSLWVQDLDSYSGTLKNGEFVYGRQQLGDGDLLQVGSFTLRITLGDGAARAAAQAAAPQVKPAPAHPSEALASTLSMNTPASGVVVGAPDPEPSDHRTVQMEAPDIEALMKSYAPAASPAAPATTEMAPPLPAAPPPGDPKVADKRAYAPTMPPPAAEKKVTAVPARPGKATMMGYAPGIVPPTGAPAPAPAAPARTTAPRAAVTPGGTPAPGAPHAPPGGTTQGRAPAVTPSAGTPSGAVRPGAAPVRPAPVAPAAVKPAPAVAARPPTGQRPVVSPENAQARTMMAEAPSAEQLKALAAQHPPASAPAPHAPPQGATMQLEAPVLPQQPKGPTTAPTPVVKGPTTAPVPVVKGPTTAPVPVVVAPVAAPMGTQPVMQAPQQQPYDQQQQYGQPQQQYAQPPQQQQPQYAQQPQPQAAPAQPGVPFGGKQYTPPQRGSFGSFSRAFSFMGQMFSLAMSNKALLGPLMLDLMITTPISIGIGIAMSFVNSRGAAYALLGLGTAMLYFVDYACNSLTASLIYDYATTGEAKMANATPRVKKALPGILIFAAVSALLDVASTYARERRDVVSKIILNILRAVWTTATYVIMPALVLEGVSFGDAFKRSKQLMDQDPTGVGAGVVAMSITSYIAAIVIFPMAWFALQLFGRIHPAFGAIMFFLLVNLYWSVSGWMKIAYATCFYMWARECEKNGTQDHALAPLPLRTALDAG